MSRKILFCAFLFILGCSSPGEKVKQVRIGMEKGSVIEILGDPATTRRLKGEDSWLYKFYSGNRISEKEVRFLDGKVTYVGEPFRPEVPAERRDAINAKRNAQQEQEYEASKQRQEIEKKDDPFLPKKKKLKNFVPVN